ncbi:hypothetical protein [Streptomyces sp. NPDC001508]
MLAADEDEDTAVLADNPLIFPGDAMRRRLAAARDVDSAQGAVT